MATHKVEPNTHSRTYQRFVPTGRSQRRPVIKGQDGSRFTDLYHAILTMPWWQFFGGLFLYYALVNLLFAFIYSSEGRGIANARGFWDCYLLSVQTLQSATYTNLLPQSPAARFFVSLEGFLGFISFAVIAGIVFARFSRPFARILFSKVAVVVPFEGVPTLMFRAANQRANLIYDATVTVSLLRQVSSPEGHVFRRFDELKLVRERTPMFALSWTVMHRIDKSSPLHNLDMDALLDAEAEITVMLRGTDETLADTIYARYSYTPDEIVAGRRFVDVISIGATGRREVDLRRFHDTEVFEVKED